MSKQLRKYQVDAKSSVVDSLSKGINSQMIVMATGTGKTFTTAQITEDYNRVLWLTHTEELIDQSAVSLIMNIHQDYKAVESAVESRGGMLDFLNFADENHSMMNEIEHFIYKNCGIIKAKRMDYNKRFVIASIQTIHRRLNKLDPNTFDLIVIDECHYATASTWNKTIEHFTPKLTLGLTATPYRTDGTSLGSIFDEIVFEYNIDKAVKQGYLCEINAIRVRTKVNLDKVRTTAGELNQKDLDNYVNCPERNNLVVDSIEKYAPNRQGIIFCVNVQHAMDLTQVLKNRGHSRVDFVVGDKTLCPNRKQIISDFKKGRIDILVNVMVLTTGFDHPNIGFVGMACPTKSLVKYMQCIGRGTRLKDEEYVKKHKQRVTILDFVDVTSRHKLINTWELDRDSEHEDKVFVTKENREKLIEARRIRLERLTEKDEVITLLSLPNASISKSGKMKEPATYKQLAYIGNLGYDIINNFYSKYDASEIISQQPASLAQIHTLKVKGYDISRGVTVGQAQLAFKELKEKELIGIEKAKEAMRIRDAIDKAKRKF